MHSSQTRAAWRQVFGSSGCKDTDRLMTVKLDVMQNFVDSCSTAMFTVWPMLFLALLPLCTPCDMHLNAPSESCGSLQIVWNIFLALPSALLHLPGWDKLYHILIAACCLLASHNAWNSSAHSGGPVTPGQVRTPAWVCRATRRYYRMSKYLGVINVTIYVCCWFAFISDGSKHLRFDDVVIQSSPQNCTVYCGGIQSGLSGKCSVLQRCLIQRVVLLRLKADY